MMWWRPRKADDLGLRRSLSGRQLPAVIAAMVFLAALAGAGTVAASGLAGRWREAAGHAVIVEVPRPAEQAGAATRADAVAGLLGPDAHLLSRAEMEARLRPFLGEAAGRLSNGLPAVFVVQGGLPPGRQVGLQRAAPGTVVSRGADWQARMLALADGLLACFWLALAVTGCVAASVVALATQAGLAMRRDAMEIVHGLGATDGMIAGRFAGRMAMLLLAGALAGAVAAVPVLLALAGLVRPFGAVAGLAPAGGPAVVASAPAASSASPSGASPSVASPSIASRPSAASSSPDLPPAGLPSAGVTSVASAAGGWASGWAGLPAPLWLLLATLPAAACAIGWATAQVQVRSWLRRLP